MFCPNCGANNPDNATTCFNCGVALKAQPQAQKPQPVYDTSNFKDYMTANIILLICSVTCAGGCIGMILSIIGIIMASQAKTALAAGDFAVAESKAKIAKIMVIVSIIMVIIGLISTAIILLIYGGSIIALIASEMMVAARALCMLI